MKKYILASFAVLVFLGVSNVAHADISTGLQGWWKFDEGTGSTVADSSGNSNTGTFVNSPSWTSSAKIGAYAELQTVGTGGSGSYVTTANTLNGTHQSETYAAWVYPTSLTGQSGHNIFLYTQDLWLEVNSSGQFSLHGRDNNDYPYTGATIPLNTWTHLALTCNDGSGGTGITTLYVNGAQVLQVSNSAVCWNNLPSKVTIGGYGNGGYGWTGRIDDARYYLRALIPADITELYNYSGLVQGGGNAGAGGSTGDVTSGLSAWWKLDDGSGSAAADSSGNANDGTLINSPSFTTGKVGTNAITLDGTSQYLQIPSTIDSSYPTSGSTNTYSMTFAAWFKTTTGGIIFAQNDGVLPPNTDGAYVPAVYVSPSTGKIYASMFWHNSGSFQIVTPNAYNDGNWHQVVDSYSNGTETLYVDGVSVGSQTQAEVGYSRAYRYFVGTGYGGSWATLSSGWTYFKGSLDDVRVYNRGLNSSEVSQMYTYANTGAGTSGGAAGGSMPLSGWAWSSTIGWISFNSKDPNTGNGGSGTSQIDYWVGMSTTTGSTKATFSGDAWSPNIGWLSFQANDVADCPGGIQGAASATVDSSGKLTGPVTGYVRVVSQIGRKDGWDGCVYLGDPTQGNPQYSPTADSNYFTDPTDPNNYKYLLGGVTYSLVDKFFRGFAWSNSVLGWLTFENPYPSSSVTVCNDCINGGSGPDFTFSGNSITMKTTDSVKTSVTINSADIKDTTSQTIAESIQNDLPTGMTVTILDNPASCTLGTSVSCTVNIQVTTNKVLAKTYTATVVGTRSDPNTACDPQPSAPCIHKGSLGIMVENPDVDPVALYIGPNATTINSVADAQKPTSYSVKKGKPFTLEWKINLDSSYNCTPYIGKGTWDHWNGSTPVDLSGYTTGSQQTGTVDIPKTDTAVNTASTYSFIVKCNSTTQGFTEQDGSANLILQSSSESEI